MFKKYAYTYICINREAPTAGLLGVFYINGVMLDISVAHPAPPD